MDLMPLALAILPRAARPSLQLALSLSDRVPLHQPLHQSLLVPSPLLPPAPISAATCVSAQVCSAAHAGGMRGVTRGDFCKTEL